MTTVVISGGTDGIGRALAVDQLRRGHTVVVVGRSATRYDSLVRAAGGRGSPHFVAADLRLVRENTRAVAEVTERAPVVDALVLAAGYVHRRRVLTEEGLEHTFALYYLSRRLLATGLRPGLAAARTPLILDTTVPGAPRTAIRWDDLQLGERFSWRAANRQSRRMGLLSALDLGGEHLRYVLYNPGFVRSGHQGDLGRPARAAVTLLANAFATPAEKAAGPIADLIAAPPDEPVSTYVRGVRRPLVVDDADRADAARLRVETQRLLETLRRDPQ